MSTTVPSFDEPAATFAPTRERRVRADVLERDDERRCRGRPELDLRADDAPGDDLVADRDDRAVDRRVDVGPGDRADVERRSAPLSSWYQAQPAPRGPGDAVPEPREQPFVRLRPDRLEHERALVAPWKPTAVRPPWATGDCTRRFPTVASTWGSGGAELTGSGAAGSTAGAAARRRTPSARASRRASTRDDRRASANHRARACARRRSRAQPGGVP